MFWKKLPIPPPATGEEDYWATLCIELAAPMTFEGAVDGQMAVGYYQNLGFRATPEAAMNQLEQLASDGKINWAESEWSKREVSELDNKIRKLVRPPDEFGVWYRSGKVFYPANQN
jgi:hypothetical protein